MLLPNLMRHYCKKFHHFVNAKRFTCKAPFLNKKLPREKAFSPKGVLYLICFFTRAIIKYTVEVFIRTTHNLLVDFEHFSVVGNKTVSLILNVG